MVWVSPRHPTLLAEAAEFLTPSFAVEEQILMISGECERRHCFPSCVAQQECSGTQTQFLASNPKGD